VAKAEREAAPATAPTLPPAVNRAGSYSLARQLGLGARTIVIDAGHGGHDPGSIGRGGLQEKDVVLDVALRLEKRVRRELGAEVIMTRASDVFIPLEERTAIANSRGADLFLSIHANASRAQGARGSEVYFLSHEASDEDSRRLAMAEGALIGGGGVSEAGGSNVALILWDMAQAEHLEESSALATRLQEELADVTGSEGRGIKQAPFRVLVGAAMPAVLVEVGFISNAEEEKLLTSDEYQARVVSALVRGLARYQQQREQRRGAWDGAGSRP
jgi:N-acetylmuramoyl-L-alanine amidase